MSEGTSSSEIIERLDKIEKMQIRDSLDRVFLLLAPFTILVLSLIVTIGFWGHFTIVMILMTFLGVLILPLIIYLWGIWSDTLHHRLNAWIFFLLYIFFFLLAIFPSSIYSLFFSHKLIPILISLPFLLAGGFFLSVESYSWIFAKKILPAFMRIDPRLSLAHTWYQGFHDYVKRKYGLIALMLIIWGHVIFWLSLQFI